MCQGIYVNAKTLNQWKNNKSDFGSAQKVCSISADIALVYFFPKNMRFQFFFLLRYFIKFRIKIV